MGLICIEPDDYQVFTFEYTRVGMPLKWLSRREDVYNPDACHDKAPARFCAVEWRMIVRPSHDRASRQKATVRREWMEAPLPFNVSTDRIVTLGYSCHLRPLCSVPRLDLHRLKDAKRSKRLLHQGRRKNQARGTFKGSTSSPGVRTDDLSHCLASNQNDLGPGTQICSIKSVLRKPRNLHGSEGKPDPLVRSSQSRGQILQFWIPCTACRQERHCIQDSK